MPIRSCVRVTFVLPVASLEGGVRVVAEYARQLDRRGHVVRVVSLGRRPSLPLARRARIVIGDVARGRLAKAWRGPTPPMPSRSHVDELGDLHDRRPHAGPIRDADVPDADVVISTWWQTVAWVAGLSPSKGRKVHFLQHDERVMARTPAERDEAGRASWREPGFRRVAVASWIAEVGRREFGAASEVIPNAVDRDLFNAPPRERNETFTVGFMNSPVPFKGADIAQEAWRLARGRVRRLGLRTFGSQPDPSRPLPPEAVDVIAPPQPQIAEIYRACDAWLFASRCEGFGLPILEAMACGTPVIGTPTGAAPDLIDGTNGVLVPADDPRAMADAIVDLAARPRERIGSSRSCGGSSGKSPEWGRSPLGTCRYTRQGSPPERPPALSVR